VIRINAVFLCTPAGRHPQKTAGTAAAAAAAAAEARFAATALNLPRAY